MKYSISFVGTVHFDAPGKEKAMLDFFKWVDKACETDDDAFIVSTRVEAEEGEEK